MTEIMFGIVFIFLIIHLVNLHIEHKKYNAKEARKYVEKRHRRDKKRAIKNALKYAYSSISRNMRQKKYEVSVELGEYFYKAEPSKEEIKIFIDQVEKELLKRGFNVKFVTGEDSKVIICNISW